jgi:hypothetical protein
MINVIERAQNKNFQAIRLLQASYHNRSLALYAGLGLKQNKTKDVHSSDFIDFIDSLLCAK